MDEKKMNITEMNDKELEQVHGGEVGWTIYKGRYYKYIGNSSKNNQDRKYICPKCGRRLHTGAGWRFYCDECNESWFFEAKLAPNLNSGVWQEVDISEYYEGYWA